MTGPIPDYQEIMRDGPRRDAFHEFHWLPMRQGALLQTLPVHDPNDLYDTTFRLFTLQSPFLRGKTERAIDLLADRRFVNLDTNLLYYQQMYDTILARHNEQRDNLASVRGTRYRRVETLFYDYIHQQRAEVQFMLNHIPSLPESSNQAAAE